MLNLIAAVLLVIVGLFHSVIGGKRLIAPIVARSDLPVILGSIEMSRVTLRAGWHALTLFWFALAIALVLASRLPFEPMVYSVFGAAFLISGVIAVILGRGRHLSWLFFLPIGGLLLWPVLV